MARGTPRARWWILTIPYAEHEWLFESYEKYRDKCRYITGQRERGSETGYEHWQVYVNFREPCRLHTIKELFSDKAHAEPTKSEAAIEYCCKEETRVEGSKFEFGTKPVVRSSPKDWELILESAKKGEFTAIPADILVRCYANIRRISMDHLKPQPLEKQVFVFWGVTGSGKSRKAWEEAGLDAYPKDPNTKFWDGYGGQENVVIDEFRGLISISNMLRWLDRYPVNVEIKGSATVLRARKIWITSNIPPSEWYPDLDRSTLDALLRRLNVMHFNKNIFI